MITLWPLAGWGRVEEGACWRRRRAKLVVKNRIDVCVDTHRSCVDAQLLCVRQHTIGGCGAALAASDDYSVRAKRLRRDGTEPVVIAASEAPDASHPAT